MGEAPTALGSTEAVSEGRQKVAIGESAAGGSTGPSTSAKDPNDPPPADLGGGMDDMQRRLDELRR